MPLLTSCPEIAEMCVDYLKSRYADTGVPSKDVFYGDRAALVDLPAITLELVDKQVIVHPGRRAEYRYAGYFMVYYGRFEDAEKTRKASDRLGQVVEDVLNEDFQWLDEDGNQRLIRAWVTRNEPGYARRGTGRVFASRITWEALSQGIL